MDVGPTGWSSLVSSIARLRVLLVVHRKELLRVTQRGWFDQLCSEHLRAWGHIL